MPSHLEWHALKVPGLVMSFAAQLSSHLAALPAAFADDDGQCPFPGISPERVETQLSASASMLEAVPGQPTVFAKAASNFASALVRQAGSTDVFIAIAFE